MTERPTGRTKDAGWEIGVSRTVDRPVEEVWDFLTSDAGTAVWLGAGVQRLDEPGAAYETEAGTAGEIRSFRPHDRVRLTWQPEDWDHDSTVQFTVTLGARGPDEGASSTRSGWPTRPSGRSSGRIGRA